MGLHNIKKGLRLPITGEPDQSKVEQSGSLRKVALLGADYIGMRPTMHVDVGDSVSRGQLLFEDTAHGIYDHVAHLGRQSGRLAHLALLSREGSGKGWDGSSPETRRCAGSGVRGQTLAGKAAAARHRGRGLAEWTDSRPRGPVRFSFSTPGERRAPAARALCNPAHG